MITRAVGLRPLVLVCALLLAGACASNPPAPARQVSLRVLTTNDFHGNLAPRNSGGRMVGGAATLAAYFAREAASFDGPTIVLDGGDIMQGTPVSNLTRGRSVIEYYNAAGYDAAALGNHEFDFGTAVLRERMAQAQFPLLAANILVTGSDTTPSWIRGTAIIERQGVRIGMIGLITEETPTATMSEYVAGLTFANGGTIIDRHVPALRAAGVDFVIVVAHEGTYCDTPTTNCSGEMVRWLSTVRNKPDLVVGGHTHEVVRTTINGIPFVESGQWGEHYTVVDLHRVRRDSVAVNVRGSPTVYVDSITPDPQLAAMVERITREIQPQLDRVIATADDSIRRGGPEMEMGRLIADAQRAKTGAQIALMNSGGVRAPVDPGPITWGELYRVQPFVNKLMVLTLRGADVRAALEHSVAGRGLRAFVSGATVTYDTTAADGSRVREIRLANGAAIDDVATYTVTVSDFMASGGDGYSMFARAVASRATGVIDLDALIEYLQAMPQPVRPPRDVRLRAIPQR